MKFYPHSSFSGRGRPLRRDFSYRATSDEEGEPIMEFLGAKSHELTHDGSIDCRTIIQENFHHCGHTTQIPVGGRCGEPGCGRISCVQCFQQCINCRKPLCGEHAKRIEVSPGVIATVCWDCSGLLRRKHALGAIGRALLSPFVAWRTPKAEKGTP